MQPSLKENQYAYWFTQILFWGCFFGIAVLMTSVFGRISSSAVTVPLFVCGLSLLASHALRHIYKRHGQDLSFPKLLLHLIWILPLAALTVQIILYPILITFVNYMPSLVRGFVPYQWILFLGYVANTTILLAMWTVTYLMVSQYRHRQLAQTAYWQSQAQLRDTELQFLHSQINSHFLFNAINNLRALILEDPASAREGLSQLADILRAVLQADTRQKNTIAEELKLVTAYIALQSLQLEARLTVDWDVDEDCLKVAIPPLLIQTLVENAISHGIAQNPHGGTLSVNVHKSDAFVEINVRNPVGSHSVQKSGNGIGLINARKRLQSMFGADAKLLLQNHNGTMEATVSIPDEHSHR